MSMSLKDLGIRYSYIGKGDKLLADFLLPALKSSVSYDRITGYYSIESLLSIAQGIEILYRKGGTMRLIIGVHSFPPEMAEASLRKEHMQNEISRIRESIDIGVATIEDSLLKERVATIAWMINDGLLSVKVASVEGGGIFHPKTLIFKDKDGNSVAAVGSSNETAYGLGGNFEQLMVVGSWYAQEAVEDQINFFSSLWSNANDDAIVEDISEELAKSLLDNLGPEFANSSLELGQYIVEDGIFAESIDMASNFFVSGQVPALYQHQERAVIDALSRWPVRALLCDEVGLGKTFEAAAIMAFLLRYGNVKRVCILTPKSVLHQWQDELNIHFGIEAWLYDSATHAYVNPSGKVLPMGLASPLSAKAPDIVLISAQYSRGSAKKKSIFDLPDSAMPDLLVLDEAHSARVSRDLSGSPKATRMHKVMVSIASKIPHIVLATATPMQKDAAEYHSMLKILGLPDRWQDTHAYRTSLKLIAADISPNTNDAFMGAKLLKSTLDAYRPSLKSLDDSERELVEEFKALGPETSNYELASFVQDKWDKFRGVFVKLHPAHLLTIRNTRRSLESVGYEFPRRNLIEEDVEDTLDVKLFYASLSDYIDNDYFSVEAELYRGRKLNTGFVKSSYRQRTASSLHSCRSSLQNRLNKVLSLKTRLEELTALEGIEDIYSLDSEMDEIALDELLSEGVDLTESSEGSSVKVSRKALLYAINIECAAINPLLNRLDKLIDVYGDPKIARSLEVALRHLNAGDTVLVFSRYTDTVSALVNEYKALGGADKYTFGIFTGQKSVMVSDGVEIPCSKEQIKTSLKSGDINIMFCSDAASEGLNLQAARVLINVDVPWVPSRLEQRIGRVARLGQFAKSVDIHNVWYPSSIEAKMYHRIQKRLQESNLAIGEFPDVVAETIKNAILFDYEDDSLSELQDIRHSVQTKALERLWSRECTKITSSESIRQKLLAICDLEWGTPVFDDGVTRRYIAPDETIVELTSAAGSSEVVSLMSLLSHMTDFEIEGLIALLNDDSEPCAFGLAGNATNYIPHESVYDLVLGSGHIELSSIFDTPETLPDPAALSLEFCVEGDIPKIPRLWIGPRSNAS